MKSITIISSLIIQLSLIQSYVLPSQKSNLKINVRRGDVFMRDFSKPNVENTENYRFKLCNYMSS